MDAAVDGHQAVFAVAAPAAVQRVLVFAVTDHHHLSGVKFCTTTHMRQQRDQINTDGQQLRTHLPSNLLLDLAFHKTEEKENMIEPLWCPLVSDLLPMLI